MTALLTRADQRRSLARERGERAEQLAREHLEARQLRTVTRNFRVRGGELDLVMREGATLVFVEVRYRSSSRFGGAAASINTRKQRRLVHAARVYLQQSGRGETTPCRFDVVAVTPDPTGEPARVEWIRNAFCA